MDNNHRTGNMDASNGRSLMNDETIHDLTDVIHDSDMNQRHDKGLMDETVKIHNLIDVVSEERESQIMNDEFHDEMVKRISQIAEKIAREVIPDIAERVIREEIEKLKKDI